MGLQEEEEYEEVSEEVGIKIPGSEEKRLTKEELKAKVLLNCHSYIPWECGSNRFASQRGMPAFGSIRRNVPKVSGWQITVDCRIVTALISASTDPIFKAAE